MNRVARAVEEQVDRARRLRRRRRAAGGLGRPRASPAPRRAGRRTSPRRAPRDRSRAPARRRAARGAWRHRAAAAARRCPRLEANAICARSRSSRARCELVERAQLGGRQQLERRVGRAGLELRLRGGQRARAAPVRGSGVSSAARSRNAAAAASAAARLRPVGRALELGGHLLVGPDARLRAVPRAAIGIDLRIGRLGQRPMHAPPVLGRCRPVDRRAHERMAEPHPGAELEQPRRLGRQPPRPAAMPEQRRPRATAASGRRPARPPRRAAAAGVSAGSGSTRRRKLSSIRLGSGSVAGSPKPPASSRRRQPARQLQQRQRVAARLGDDPVAHALVQRPAAPPTPSSVARVAVRQAFEPQLRQPGQRVELAGLAHGEHQRDRLRQQAPRHEGEHLHRRLGPATARRRSGRAAAAVLGRVGQQAQDREPDEEAIGRERRRQPERRPERVALRSAAAARDRSSSGAHSWCSPANGSSISDSTPAARATRQPSTRARARTPAAPSCRSPPRRARRARRCARLGLSRAADQGPRTRYGGLAARINPARVSRRPRPTKHRPLIWRDRWTREHD